MQFKITPYNVTTVKDLIYRQNMQTSKMKDFGLQHIFQQLINVYPQVAKYSVYLEQQVICTRRCVLGIRYVTSSFDGKQVVTYRAVHR